MNLRLVDTQWFDLTEDSRTIYFGLKLLVAFLIIIKVSRQL